MSYLVSTPRRYVLLVALASTLFVPGRVVAQGRGSALGGFVLDAQTLKPLPGALVTLKPQQAVLASSRFTDCETKETSTSATGEFRFDGLSLGEHTISVSRRGYLVWQSTVKVAPVTTELEPILLVPGSDSTAHSPGWSDTISVRELQIPKSAQKYFMNALRERDVKQRLERSIPLFHKAIEIYPEFDEAYAQLGLVHLLRGEMPLAERALTQAVGLNPENPRARALLGKIFLQQGKTAAATRELNEAIRRAPTLWSTHLDLAWALLRENRAAEAALPARRAHQLHPQSLAVHTVLYSILLKLGHKQEALGELEEILDRFAGDPLTRKIQEERIRVLKTLSPLEE